MTDSSVEFRGPRPFSIAVAQSASAQALGGAVEMTLRCVVGDDPLPRPIRLQMTHGVANRLGHDLVKAALEIEASR